MVNLIKYCFIFLLAVVAATASCKDEKKSNHSKAPGKIEPAKVYGYDFNQVETCEMKKRLTEISGIHYLKDNLFVAIEDEDGAIFTVDFATGKIVAEREFAGAGDYEDITMDANFFYVLRSDGTIYTVSRATDSAKVAVNAIKNSGELEFESIYLDSNSENLVLICKNCPGTKNLSFHVYGYNLKRATFSDQPVYSIEAASFFKGKGHEAIKPSAAAIHPIEKKLYVLCSIGKILLVCDLQGKVEKVYHLNPELFHQPEGIAFTPNGDMFISNESNHSKANILKLAYRSY